MKLTVWATMISAGLAALTAIAARNLPLSAPVQNSMILATAIAWSVSWLSYIALSWALTRSDKSFYGLFGGGVLLRLAALGALAYGVHQNARFSTAAALLTYVACLLVFLLLESWFLIKQQTQGTDGF
ncbi:MAG: hypothetical protein HYT79_11925 [Elusimicrobia bacterium]|nr:hypothetical protein [Elusimicrobiota bacterium]